MLKGFAEDFERKKTSDSAESTQISTQDDDDHKHLTFTLKIPYLGKNGENLVRILKRKIDKNLKEKIWIRVVFTTNKISKFCGVKDKIPDS